MKCHSRSIFVWDQFESIDHYWFKGISINRIYILDAAKMEKLPDCKIPTNCIGWYCLHKVPVTDLLKHHYKYVTLRCFYDLTFLCFTHCFYKYAIPCLYYSDLWSHFNTIKVIGSAH